MVWAKLRIKIVKVVFFSIQKIIIFLSKKKKRKFDGLVWSGNKSKTRGREREERVMFTLPLCE